MVGETAIKPACIIGGDGLVIIAVVGVDQLHLVNAEVSFLEDFIENSGDLRHRLSGDDHVAHLRDAIEIMVGEMHQR